MRIEVCELPMSSKAVCLAAIDEFRKTHPRTKDISPKQVPFLKDFVLLVKSKKGTKKEVLTAFDDISNIWNAGEREVNYLTLPLAFAKLMEGIAFSDLPLYKQALIKILNELY